MEMDKPKRAVVKRSRYDCQKLHFPAEAEPDAEPLPLCPVVMDGNPWVWRDLETLPPAHRDWCERCKARARGEWPDNTELFDSCPLCGDTLDGSLTGHLPECDK